MDFSGVWELCPFLVRADIAKGDPSRTQQEEGCELHKLPLGEC